MAKPIGKTIGEVEKLTGISKRELKYYIERNITRPSQQSRIGYWLYSEADIRRVRLAALCRELGCPGETIRAVCADPSRWREALDRQILRLREQKDHVEDQLLLAEFLRHISPAEGRSGGIDGVEPDPGGSGYLLREGSALKWREDTKRSLCRFLYQTVSEDEAGDLLRELAALREKTPDAPAVRELTQKICDTFWRRKSLSPRQVLLLFRLAHRLTGMGSILDQLLGKTGGAQSVTEALQAYCDSLLQGENVFADK